MNLYWLWNLDWSLNDCCDWIQPIVVPFGSKRATGFFYDPGMDSLLVMMIWLWATMINAIAARMMRRVPWSRAFIPRLPYRRFAPSLATALYCFFLDWCTVISDFHPRSDSFSHRPSLQLRRIDRRLPISLSTKYSHFMWFECKWQLYNYTNPMHSSSRVSRHFRLVAAEAWICTFRSYLETLSALFLFASWYLLYEICWIHCFFCF